MNTKVEADPPAVFTQSSAVLVAISQVGVVVAGCLGAATAHRLTGGFGRSMPLATILLLDYWMLFMAVPLIWIFAALRLRERAEVSNDAKVTAFWFGVFLLAAMALLGICAFLGPFLSAGGVVITPGTER